jgi:hypothetical protein
MFDTDNADADADADGNGQWSMCPSGEGVVVPLN